MGFSTSWLAFVASAAVLGHPSSFDYAERARQIEKLLDGDVYGISQVAAGADPLVVFTVNINSGNTYESLLLFFSAKGDSLIGFSVGASAVSGDQFFAEMTQSAVPFGCRGGVAIRLDLAMTVDGREIRRGETSCLGNGFKDIVLKKMNDACAAAARDLEVALKEQQLRKLSSADQCRGFMERAVRSE